MLRNGQDLKIYKRISASNNPKGLPGKAPAKSKNLVDSAHTGVIPVPRILVPKYHISNTNIQTTSKMVASISPPILSTLLPSFLSHLPTSFASPKPPPSLPPLLTPLLRSRLTHLSFNLTAENSWLSLLTWSSIPSDSQTLQDHLASQDYYFLHQPPSPNTFVNKGYRRLDGETVQCLVEVTELEVVVLYQFVGDDITSEDGEVGNAWKVHDERTEKQQGEEEDDDDDYWGRYDDEETESVAGDEDTRPPVVQHQHTQPQSHVQIAASMLARRVLQEQTQEEEDDKEEEEYYARYANVEPVLDNPGPTTGEGLDRRSSISTNHTSTSATFDAQATSTPLTAFTHPSTKVSPVITATTLTNNASHHPKPEPATAKKIVAGLESAAEVHTQSEVAIQQHVSTSIKSLYRLWKAGGMDGEEFGKFLAREVEVLRVVDEAGELGS
ncbi:uncharacterized protein DFL_003024 [Arthrobotrys flagrans]|uniref:Uncharacterized protein n=1 Tax=Arthrobotrys flagrans TaxID=97331 RepID=A0A437AC62_ARTFL|nr:hypothetical protein DFL_003024 [Arthrobotrys flagrans]